MRLVRIPAGKDVARWINPDLITEILVCPCPEDDKHTEVSIQFGEYYIELRFADKAAAMTFLSTIANVSL